MENTKRRASILYALKSLISNNNDITDEIQDPNEQDPDYQKFLATLRNIENKNTNKSGNNDNKIRKDKKELNGKLDQQIKKLREEKNKDRDDD